MRNCEYTKPNGEFCHSPALRGRDYCHWHLTCLARRLRAEKQEVTLDRVPLELPPLEDANSIQLAIMMVGDALLHDRVGPRKAGQLLYLLQLASSNLKQGVCFQPRQAAGSQAKTQDVTLCSSYDSLEADYDIGEHAEQLQAEDPDAEFHPAEEAEEQPHQEAAERKEEEEEEPTIDEEMFLRHVANRDFDYPRVFGRNHPDFAVRFAEFHELVRQERENRRQWLEEERRQREEKEEQERLQREARHKARWDQIREVLALALTNQDPKTLQQCLAFCYDRSGAEYETAAWKPAARQLVLFPRKPPENVRKKWYKQRQANCKTELDNIADREAAQKKIKLSVGTPA